MRGYNPYAVRFSALALFIVPLLNKGEVAPNRKEQRFAKGVVLLALAFQIELTLLYRLLLKLGQTYR